MYCPDCRYQEEFCRCPMRRRDWLLLLAIFAAMLGYVIWSSLHPRVQEQGYRVAPPAVRQVPPPQPRRARA